MVGLGTPERILLASISIDGASDGSTMLVIRHEGGDPIGTAFTSTDWADMEVRINGALATGTKTLNGGTITDSTTYDFTVGDTLELGLAPLQPGDVITIIYRPANQVITTVTVQGPASYGPSVSKATLGGTEYFAASPSALINTAIIPSSTQSFSWDISIEATSFSEENITVAASGWLVVPLPDAQKQMISMAVSGYKTAPQMFNQQALQYIQGYLQPSSYNIQVTDLNITQLDWDSDASKLTFAVTVTIESSTFSEFTPELPVTITTSGSGSIPTTGADFTELTLNAMFKVITRRAVAELQMNLSDVAATVSLDFEFELPTDVWGVVTRMDNMLVVDFSKLGEYLPGTISVPQVPSGINVSFTLIVPQDAEVENLPSGYTESGDTYTWTGQSAVNAIVEIITSETGTRISYQVGPASVTVQNIQSSVGQTITVGSNNVESVEVESAQLVAVNFERGQPIRTVRMRLIQGVQNVSVQAQQLSEKPTEVSALPSGMGLVSYYLKIEATAQQVEDATIEFKVSKLWVRANNIDATTVRLLRYSNGAWSELSTSQISDDENNIYFSAATPGFSVFAVTAMAQTSTQPSSDLPLLLAIIIVVVVMAAVLTVVGWRYLSSRRK